MKKLIFHSILFLLLSITVYLLLMTALFYIRPGGSPLLFRTTDGLHWKGGASYMSFREFNPNNQYDIIILGSSHAYRGYDPRAFKAKGLNAFNLGSNAQSIMNSYYVAENYINADNCKLLILDVFSGPIVGDPFESTADLVENINSERAAWEMAWGLKDIRSINMITLRYISALAKPQYFDSSYVSNGYCETADSVKKAPDYKSIPFKPSDTQVHHLERLLDFFGKQKIPVVAVTHPMPKNGDTLRHIEFVKFINPYLQKHQIPYIDFALKHDLHSLNHFYDHNHLNKAGVDIFNKMLLQELEKKAIIPF